MSQDQEKAWKNHKNLMLRIQKCRAELAVSLNQMEITDTICADLFTRVDSVEEKFSIYSILLSRHEVVVCACYFFQVGRRGREGGERERKRANEM